MKKVILSLICLLLVGCANVSKEEYDQIEKENEKLKKQIQQLSDELNVYKESDEEKVKISGGLVLTVDAKLNDPNVEEKVVNALVVRLFQSNQEIIRVSNEIAKKVEVGETYFFEMKTKTIDNYSLQEVQDILGYNIGSMQWLEVVDVREPKENEYGLAENLYIEVVK